MNYRHRFVVRAPLARVYDFHCQAGSLAAITPPPLKVQLNHVPDVLGEGDEMDFSLGVGPLHIPWVAHIEHLSAAGFTDRQVSGPFSQWVHRHNFIVVDDQTTEVVDEITLRLRSQPLWWAIGFGMWVGLPLLFAFRSYKTRKILQ